MPNIYIEAIVTLFAEYFQTTRVPQSAIAGFEQYISDKLSVDSYSNNLPSVAIITDHILSELLLLFKEGVPPIDQRVKSKAEAYTGYLLAICNKHLQTSAAQQEIFLDDLLQQQKELLQTFESKSRLIRISLSNIINSILSMITITERQMQTHRLSTSPPSSSWHVRKQFDGLRTQLEAYKSRLDFLDYDTIASVSVELRANAVLARLHIDISTLTSLWDQEVAKLTESDGSASIKDLQTAIHDIESLVCTMHALGINKLRDMPDHKERIIEHHCQNALLPNKHAIKKLRKHVNTFENTRLFIAAVLALAISYSEEDMPESDPNKFYARIFAVNGPSFLGMNLAILRALGHNFRPKEDDRKFRVLRVALARMSIAERINFINIHSIPEMDDKMQQCCTFAATLNQVVDAQLNAKNANITSMSRQELAATITACKQHIRNFDIDSSEALLIDCAYTIELLMRCTQQEIELLSAPRVRFTAS